MYKGPIEADSLAMELRKRLVDRTNVDIALAPPFLSIPAVAARLHHTGLHLAAQNLHAASAGAYTGEVSGEMLRQAGVAYVIVGHSERRTLFGEDDSLVAAKVAAAFRSGLLPILCVGETLAEREAGKEQEVVARQVFAAMGSLPPDQAVSVTIAYEPVWAIGTGRSASAEQAQAMHAFIRAAVASRFPSFVPAQLRIQYGGSVKAGNAATLLSQPDIDGALVGGASLDPDEFLAIVEAAARRPT